MTSITSNLTCPITHMLFVDPVVDNDGNTWERSAIERAIDSTGVSPLTRRTMTKTELRPNRDIRRIIEEMSPAQKMEEDVQMSVSSPIRFVSESEGTFKMFSILSEDSTSDSTAVDIVFGIDTSGSTCSSAKNGNEDDGLTLLDIFRHGVRTVIEGMGPDDRIALVDWSSTATVVFPLDYATVANKAKFVVKLAMMESSGSTNIWDGCKVCLDLLTPTMGRFQTAYILTDGVPNVEPPRGYIPTLKRYMDSRPDLACSLNMFGFGYSLRSKLLDEMAREGNGYYTYIPDSGMVGTGFINAAAKTMATMGEHAVLKLETKEDINIHGNFPMTRTSWGYNVHVGNITRGQSRDIMVSSTEPIEATFSFRDIKSGETHSIPVSLVSNGRIVKEKNRVAFASFISKNIDLCEKNQFETAEACRRSFSSDDSKIMKEINDQIKEAIVYTEYARWGQHYLRSICPAHFGQYSTNFKDPKMQEYGGSQFNLLRDMLDEKFNALPAPRPSAPHQSDSLSYRGGRTTSYTVSVDMSNYNDRAGPCFAGYCLAQTPEGRKPLSELRQGDTVITPEGQDEILRVLKTSRESPNLCVFPGGLESTPYHPIKCPGDEKWGFPAEMKQAEKRQDCDAVYSFLLKGNSTAMIINGITCITLSHGITDDSVAAHAYFGSDKVRQDVMSADHENGVVIVRQVKRSDDNLVCGLCFY